MTRSYFLIINERKKPIKTYVNIFFHFPISYQASDSLASESPTSSISRLPVPFGSSNDASHRGSTSQSEHSSIATNGTSPLTHRKGTTPSVKKSSSFKKRIKSAVVGSLKKGKVCVFLFIILS